jgi:hypothetical protein
VEGDVIVVFKYDKLFHEDFAVAGQHPMLRTRRAAPLGELYADSVDC